MNVFNRFLTPFLIALLVLTSASLAVARAAPDAAGQMVLCTGSGPVVVHVDETGTPVDPPHYCPDCAMTLLAAVAGENASFKITGSVSALVFETSASHFSSAPDPGAKARGPPLV